MDRTRIPAGFNPAVLQPPLLDDNRLQVRSLAVDLAGRCNLSCRYCGEAATQPSRSAMSGEMLEQVWSWFGSNCGRAPNASIHLGSGEPFLAWPRMQQLRTLMQGSTELEVDTTTRVFLTTNATRIDGAAVEWLVDSGWDLKISMDGPSHVHDRWRVTTESQGTYERVARTVCELAPRMGERLGVVAVLCRDSNPREVLDAVAALGVRRVELVPVEHREPAIRMTRADLRGYEEFIRDYAERLVRSGSEEDLPIVGRFHQFVLRVMGYGNQWVSCSAGRSYAAVGADGVLYPCMRFVGVERYTIGQLPEGVDEDAARSFRHGPGRAYDQRQTCSECWAAPLCGGPCFAAAELIGPEPGIPSEAYCAVRLADAAAAVWLVQQLRRREPERLLRFLPISG